MMLEHKSTAHAVDGSTGGKREQVCTGLVSISSIPEAAGPVKDRLGAKDRDDVHLRRLAAMMTEKQKWGVIRLALVIEETKDSTASPRLLEYLRRNGCLERFLEAERGGKGAEI
nr:hypothetical protein [uncultured Oscillibacter sp.]